MTIKTITTDWLREQLACDEGTDWFKAQNETDALAVLQKLRGDHWDWYRWLAVRLMTHKQKVEWACFCAEQVLFIFEKKYPMDDRPRKAITAAKAWAKDPSEANRERARNDADAAYAAAAELLRWAAAAEMRSQHPLAAAYAAAATAAAYAADAATADAYAADAYAAYTAYTAYTAAAREEMRNLCADEAERILKGTQP